MLSLTSLVTLSSLAVLCVTAQTNLPDVPPGVFNASARIEINTTVDALWSAITNFPAYPDWNPFVRYVQTTLIFSELNTRVARLMYQKLSGCGRRLIRAATGIGTDAN